MKQDSKINSHDITIKHQLLFNTNGFLKIQQKERVLCLFLLYFS